MLVFTGSVKPWVTPACSIYGACTGVMSGTKYHSSRLRCPQRLACVGLPGACPRGIKKALEDFRSSPHLPHTSKTVESRSHIEARSGCLLHLCSYNYSSPKRVGTGCSPALCGSLCSSSYTQLFGHVWIRCSEMLVWEISVKMDTS